MRQHVGHPKATQCTSLNKSDTGPAGTSNSHNKSFGGLLESVSIGMDFSVDSQELEKCDHFEDINM